MSIKAVIDTNVLVSALWTYNTNSPTARISQALLDGKFTILVNADILAEYDDVLHRKKFSFDKSEVDKMLAHIKVAGEAVVPMDSGDDFPDPDDKVFFCTAIAGNANLVTGNAKHYPKSAIVVSPAEFCRIAQI